MGLPAVCVSSGLAQLTTQVIVHICVSLLDKDYLPQWFFGGLCGVSNASSAGDTWGFQGLAFGGELRCKNLALQVLAAISSGLCFCHARDSEGTSRGFCRSDFKACYCKSLNCYNAPTLCCLCLQRVYLVPGISPTQVDSLSKGQTHMERVYLWNPRGLAQGTLGASMVHVQGVAGATPAYTWCTCKLHLHCACLIITSCMVKVVLYLMTSSSAASCRCDSDASYGLICRPGARFLGNTLL